MKNRGYPRFRSAGLLLSAILFMAAAAALSAAAQSRPSQVKVEPQLVEQGRYLVKIAGCNDCHTPGYAESGGQVPETQWIVGDKLGWRGPWGTTYPSNLRLFFQNTSEDEWVQFASNTRTRPPMPWFALRDMSERDLRAIFQFARTLGPAGQAAPAYLPAEKVPPPPYVQFPMPAP